MYKISDRIFKIQENAKSEPIVVNHDKLKIIHSRNRIDLSWCEKLKSQNSKPIDPADAEQILEADLNLMPSDIESEMKLCQKQKQNMMQKQKILGQRKIEKHQLGMVKG